MGIIESVKEFWHIAPWFAKGFIALVVFVIIMITLKYAKPDIFSFKPSTPQKQVTPDSKPDQPEPKPVQPVASTNLS